MEAQMKADRIKWPISVGCYRIGGASGMHVHLLRRPRWVARFLCRHLLEWEWIDAIDYAKKSGKLP